jgi:5-aminolevulinate synthase
VYRRQRNSQYCGNNHPLVELERELVELHRKHAALVFTSGYISNVTGISTQGRAIADCLILRTPGTPI